MLNFMLLSVLLVSDGSTSSVRPNENVDNMKRQDYIYNSNLFRVMPYHTANTQNTGVYRVARQDYVSRSDVPFSSPRQYVNVDHVRSPKRSSDYWSSQKASPLPRHFIPAPAEPTWPSSTSSPPVSDDEVLPAISNQFDEEHPLPAFTYLNSRDTSTARYYSMNDELEISDEQKELLLASQLAPKRSESDDQFYIRRRRTIFPKDYPGQEIPFEVESPHLYAISKKNSFHPVLPTGLEDKIYVRKIDNWGSAKITEKMSTKIPNSETLTAETINSSEEPEIISKEELDEERLPHHENYNGLLSARVFPPFVEPGMSNFYYPRPILDNKNMPMNSRLRNHQVTEYKKHSTKPGS